MTPSWSVLGLGRRWWTSGVMARTRSSVGYWTAFTASVSLITISKPFCNVTHTDYHSNNDYSRATTAISTTTTTTTTTISTTVTILELI